MLGIFLTCAVLCAFSVILLTDQILNGVEKIIHSQETPNPIYFKIQSFCQILRKDTFRQAAGYASFLFGLWTLFGPDFGSVYGGLPIIGALVPALVLCIDAFILNPTILQWAPLAPYREKVDFYIQQVYPVAGWITLATTIAHSLFYYLPFF